MESGAQQGRARASSRRAAGGAGGAAEPSRDGDALTAKKTASPKPRCISGCTWMSAASAATAKPQAAPSPPAGQQKRRTDRCVWLLPSRGSKVLGRPAGRQPAWLGGALSGPRKAQQTLSRGLPRSPREGGAWTRMRQRETSWWVESGTGDTARAGPECCLEEKVLNRLFLQPPVTQLSPSQPVRGLGQRHTRSPCGELDRRTVPERRVKGSRAGRGNTLQ